MSKLTRLKYIVRTSIIVIMVCYFGLMAILSLPLIQNNISRIAARQLSELFHTEVSIGNVDLGLLNRIILQNVLIKDQSNNEMLKASRLSAKFELLPLLHGHIRISSVQLFGLNARINKADENAIANCQFLIDALASKDTVKKENNLDLRINAVLIRRGQVHYDLLSAPETEGVFNASHIGVENISATLSLKALNRDTINMQVKRMSLTEKSGFVLEKLSMKFVANHRGVRGEKIEMRLPNSKLSIDTLFARFDSVACIATADNSLKYAANLRANVTPSDLKMFVPALSDFNDKALLHVKVHGEGSHAQCDEFDLSNPDKNLRLKIEGVVNHWNTPKDIFVFGKVSDLTAEKEGLKWLFHNLNPHKETPAIVERLGDTYFSGDVSGKLNQLTTHGTLLCEAGEVDANITMHSDTISGLRSFSGHVSSQELNVGKLAGQEKTLGNAAFDISLKGFSYHNGAAESYIKGVISSLTYKDYEYKNISMDGKYTPGGFNGKLSLNDENGNIEINGRFDTRKRIPEYNLRAVVKNFRPNALHLTDKYKDTDLAVNLTADFSGRSIDDMQGSINIDSLSVSAPDPEESYFLDNFSIKAENGTDNEDKQITVSSPFMNGIVKGHYSYRTLPASIMKAVQKHIPSLIGIGKNNAPTTNDFQFNFTVDDSKMLRALNVPLEIRIPATLEGYVDDKHNRMRITGYAPEFIYDGTYYEGGNLQCSNTDKNINCQIRANKRKKNGEMLNVAVSAKAQDDVLTTILNWGNNTTSTFCGNLKAETRFKQPQGKGKLLTQINLKPSTVILNDTVWNVHPSEITIDNGTVSIDHFLFEHKKQFLAANGKIGKAETDSCIVELNDINLNYVMNLINFDAVKFSGMITGKVHLHHLLSDPVMYTRLDAKGFSLNDALLGRGDIRGVWDAELGGVRLEADIKEHEGRSTCVKGYVSPKEKGLDLNIQANGTTLAFLAPFIDGIFEKPTGRAYGHVRLYGPFSQLDLEGAVKANATMKIIVLNTTYHAETTDSVRITSGRFDFRNVQLSDMQGHKGTANGALQHTKLKNLKYDFRFNTQGMNVFYSEKETPDFPFYGKIYATGDVLLRGGNNTLNVDGTLRSNSNTVFTYVASTAAEATDNQFITFVDKTPRRKQEVINTELYHHLNVKDGKDNGEMDTPTDMHIDLQIDASPEATMRIVLDAAAGDYISANGSGNLHLNFYNKGDFQLFGTYNIEEGVYKMSMQNVIRKDFTLQRGGIVSFNGNPKEANLNVKAIYTVTSASLNDLVADASSNKGTVRVNCIVNLTGSLTSPTLKFDLELPTVNDEDRALVRSLTNTEESMNTQIIYLLGIGKFYTQDYNSNNTQSDATSSLAFSTLSGQLNNILSQMITSQHWNVGTNLSTGQRGWSDVEAEAILSGRLLNNRLIINGNFGYKDNPMRNTNFVGDFEAQWLLTKSGEFRLKGYNQTNDRYFTKTTLTTQGVGLMYQKEFSNWRQLFDWILLRKRKNKATVAQPEPAAREKRENKK